MQSDCKVIFLCTMSGGEVRQDRDSIGGYTRCGDACHPLRVGSLEVGKGTFPNESASDQIPLSSIKSLADLILGSRALMSRSSLCFCMAGSMIAGFRALISSSIDL